MEPFLTMEQKLVVTDTGKVDLEIFFETAGFNFGVNWIINFLLNEKDCSLLMGKCFYPNS